MRGVIVSDLHAGGKHGMAPPAYLNDKLYPAADVIEKMWEFWSTEVKSYGKLDFGVLNGDGTEGPVRKDPITMAYTDMSDQADMCVETLLQADVKKWYIVGGTGFHVTGALEFEEIVVDRLKLNGVDAEWHQALRLKLYDKWYQFRHMGRRSDTPYGQYTQLMKEAERTRSRELRRGIPPSDLSYVAVRSHVHYYAKAENRSYIGMSTPCYKLEGDDAFSRKMMAYFYDIGHVVLETAPQQEPIFTKRLLPLEITSMEDEVCLTE